MFRPAFVALRCAAGILLLGAALLLPRIALGQVVALDVLTRNGYGSVPLKRPQPNVLTVDATLDGKSLRLVVDTGASAGTGALYLPLFAARGRTTESMAGGIEAAGGSQLTGNRTGKGGVIRIGNVEMRDVPLIFSNLPVFLRPGTPDGLIGAPFLRACSAVIDLQNLTLYLRPPGQGRRVMLGEGLRGLNMTEVPMPDGSVAVEINGHRGRMLVDTGAFFSGIDNSRATKMGLSSHPSRWGLADAGGKQRRADRAILQSFKIGDFSVPTPDILVSSMGDFTRRGDLVGLLGMDVLGKNGAVIDYSQGKLYLQKGR